MKFERIAAVRIGSLYCCLTSKLVRFFYMDLFLEIDLNQGIR
jgi:hypothetical protein